MSGVLARYPKIKFVSVESGIGWIPFVLEALDYQFKDNRVKEERPELDHVAVRIFRPQRVRLLLVRADRTASSAR